MILTMGAYRIPVRAMRPEEMADARGLYYPAPRCIALAPAEPPREQADSLIHECIHAIWDVLDMGKRVSEESVATKLGTALANLLEANPSLMSSLTAALYHGVPIVKGAKQ